MIEFNIENIYKYPSYEEYYEFIFTDLDITIKRGEDTFFYGENYRKESRPSMWYATHQGNIINNKGYKDLEKCYKDTLKHINKYNKREIKRLQEINDNINKILRVD